MTLEQYLAFEELGDVRHEYVGGELHAMVGASERHQLIPLNLAIALQESARLGGCRIILKDVKLRVASNIICYPDITVVCDADDDDPYIKERPTLVVEVLSLSTAATDRWEKMMAYYQLPGLLCYLIVHQDEQRVERHWRESVDGRGELEMVIDGAVDISGLGIQVSLDEIYEGIELGASD